MTETASGESLQEQELKLKLADDTQQHCVMPQLTYRRSCTVSLQADGTNQAISTHCKTRQQPTAQRMWGTWLPLNVVPCHMHSSPVARPPEPPHIRKLSVTLAAAKHAHDYTVTPTCTPAGWPCMLLRRASFWPPAPAAPAAPAYGRGCPPGASAAAHLPTVWDRAANTPPVVKQITIKVTICSAAAQMVVLTSKTACKQHIRDICCSARCCPLCSFK